MYVVESEKAEKYRKTLEEIAQSGIAITNSVWNEVNST